MLPTVPPPILGVATNRAGFLGVAAQGPIEQAVLVTSFSEYERIFGTPPPGRELFLGVHQFFENGGVRAWIVRLRASSTAAIGRGLSSLDAVDHLGLLCLPGISGGSALAAAAAYARSRRAFFVAEPSATRPATVTALRAIRRADRGHVATHFPRLKIRDPLDPATTILIGPSAAVAGMLSRFDIYWGVQTVPAGTTAHLLGAVGVASAIDEQGAASLRREGINAIRQVPGHGIVAWGARTLGAGSESGEDWQYIPVRRTALYLEESLYGGIGWAVFEPNDEPTWRRLREAIEAFLEHTRLQNGFAGATPAESYFVRCGSNTTTQNDIDNGVVVIEIGFAPFRPAEFVQFRIRHRRH
jgi:hypothetical protein